MTQKSKFEVIVPDGPSMIRLYHKNIVLNDKAHKEPRIQVPPIVERAKMVVNTPKEMIIRTGRDTDG